MYDDGSKSFLLFGCFWQRQLRIPLSLWVSETSTEPKIWNENVLRIRAMIMQCVTVLMNPWTPETVDEVLITAETPERSIKKLNASLQCIHSFVRKPQTLKLLIKQQCSLFHRESPRSTSQAHSVIAPISDRCKKKNFSISPLAFRISRN